MAVNKYTEARRRANEKYNAKTYEEMQRIFEKAFSEWTVLKFTVVDQQYDIPRDSGICELKTSVVTFVAKKG